MKAAFDKSFISPFARHAWRSKQGRRHWVDLEPLLDMIAGPLSSIVSSGGCAYVYSRDDSYFHGVADPDSLSRRLREWFDRLSEGVVSFAPEGPAEREDMNFMQTTLSDIQNLIQRGVEIERTRFGTQAEAQQGIGGDSENRVKDGTVPRAPQG